MKKKPNNNLLVGLDIGTAKILVVVMEVKDSSTMEVIGVGHHPATGLRKGVVSNIDATVHSISRAIEEAETMSGCQIYSVYAGIAGPHVSSVNSHGVVAVQDGNVKQSDVERVLDAAKAMAIPSDRRILHVIPQDFIIDGQDGIREPIGMSGVRMEARVHIVLGAESAAQNIIKCINLCGLDVDDIILDQVASSETVLNEDEKELGVCMIDIGGGTTDIAVFSEGAIRYTSVIPIAGNQVTNDIAVAFHTSTREAEETKKKHGCTLEQLVADDQTIKTISTAGRAPKTLSRRSLASVIQPRMEELLLLVQAELEKNGFSDSIGSGIVLTGGSSRMEGLTELAEEIFHVPVRQGLPNYQGNLSEIVCTPVYSTGIGLTQFGYVNRDHAQSYKLKNGNWKLLLDKTINWFRGSF